MTVNQGLSQVSKDEPPRETVYQQLKEITGIEDISVLSHALEASKNSAGRYDLAQAVTLLLEGCADEQKEKAALDPAVEVDESETKADEGKEQKDVIDLTENPEYSEREQIQKAIALSLKDHHPTDLGTQVTAEDQDISRVIEQSLAESKVGTRRRWGEGWQDPINPHERKRVNETPVGLKNVGNTCWFSAVIQSLFHLPVFRQLVLNFSFPTGWNKESSSTSSMISRFMQELRQLFALMVGTKRNYVDPSAALQILKESFQLGNADNQEDVSEFTHKLLEWLEEAFKVGSDEDEAASNPMVDLFYGQQIVERHVNGEVNSNAQIFGQFPVQVNDFPDIHDSLEAATFQEEESHVVHGENNPKCAAVKEHWFTRLPPVLIFELSRFHFNQQMGKAEKIHNQFEFPERIYMDRYMHENKNVTKNKREQVQRLRLRREELQMKLEGYLNYGSGAKRFPLQQVLQYTMEFVETKREDLPVLDVEMNSPLSSINLNSQTNSAQTSPVKSPSAFGDEDEDTLMEMDHESSTHFPSEKSCTFPEKPTPKHVSDSEINVFHQCLTRWRQEVENDVRELREHISNIDCHIKNMYDDSTLQKVIYRLHAVLVHEGQAASGHYWAYVYDNQMGTWLKFNDNTVSPVEWHELHKESIGGHHNTSAYCLMYIDHGCRNLLLDDKTGEAVLRFGPQTVALLPEDMKQLVSRDNVTFEEELKKWDESMKLLNPPEEPMKGIEEEVVKLDPKESGKQSHVSPSILTSLQIEHATILQDQTMQDVLNAAKISKSTTIEAILNQAFSVQLKRLRELNGTDSQDVRLLGFPLFLLSNKVDKDDFIRMSILESFTSPSLNNNERSAGIRQCALRHLQTQIAKLSKEQISDYNAWHRIYGTFRLAVVHFVAGAESFSASLFHDSLPYLMKACHLNVELIKENKGTNSCLHHSLLLEFRRQCLEKLNDYVLMQLRGPDSKRVQEIVDIVNYYIIPCMIELNDNEDDCRAAENVRAAWCKLLEQDVKDERKKEILFQLLQRVLDPGEESVRSKVLAVIRPANDLPQRYLRCLETANAMGFCVAAPS